MWAVPIEHGGGVRAYREEDGCREGVPGGEKDACPPTGPMPTGKIKIEDEAGEERDGSNQWSRDGEFSRQFIILTVKHSIEVDFSVIERRTVGLGIWLIAGGGPGQSADLCGDITIKCTYHQETESGWEDYISIYGWTFLKFGMNSLTMIEFDQPGDKARRLLCPCLPIPLRSIRTAAQPKVNAKVEGLNDGRWGSAHQRGDILKPLTICGAAWNKTCMMYL
ncbi:hypothetical protein B0H11DRAFT_2184884 [Mycena galericulata]|nr:hypothetical protein B0H11DRAFT_2184884 [Mycena galericulata]